MKRREFILSALALSSCYDPGSDVAAPKAPSVPLILPVGSSGYSNGTVLTVTPPGGALTAFGTKSGNAPTQVDFGQDGTGNINAGYGSHGPSGFTGANLVYNMQNRAAPFQAGGSSIINGPHPYCNTFLAGCSAWNFGQGGASNTGEQIWVSNNHVPNTFTYPYYQTRSYYTRDDPYWWFVPDADTIDGLTATLTNGSNQIVITAGTLTGLATNGTTNFETNRGTATDISQGIGTASVITGLNGSTITISDNFTGPTGSYSSCFTSNSLADNNNKTWDLCQGTSIYQGNGEEYDQYISFFGHQTIGATTYTHPHSNSDVSTVTIQGNNQFPSPAFTSPFGNYSAVLNPANPANTCNGNVVGWKQVTHVVCWTSATSGYFKWYENNSLVLSYAGPTMWSTFAFSNTVAESIGGYRRNYGPTGTYAGYVSANPNGNGQTTQWNYLAQMYLDLQQSGLARLVLSNSSSWAPGNAGAWGEPQPYSAWSPASITYTVNKGNLAAGQAYLWYVDEANSVAPTVVSTFTLN